MREEGSPIRPDQERDDRLRLAATFRHAGVAAAYAARPPYPPEVIDVLVKLVDAACPRVLDLGAGDGALARPLARRIEHVDAVEPSEAMVSGGRSRPGGTASTLTWRVEAAEETAVIGPYGLVTAGASLHWMDAVAVLARVAALLSPEGVLAVVDQSYAGLPWAERLVPVIVEHSRSPRYRAEDVIVERLAAEGLLDVLGRYETPPTSTPQSLEAYVEQFFSTASLARELMSAQEAARFAAQVTNVVAPYAEEDGTLPTSTVSSVVWGRPAVSCPS